MSALERLLPSSFWLKLMGSGQWLMVAAMAAKGDVTQRSSSTKSFVSSVRFAPTQVLPEVI
jgi:hypothetical protein